SERALRHHSGEPLAAPVEGRARPLDEERRPSLMRNTRRSFAALAALVAALIGVSSLFNIASTPTMASSHREAPTIAQDPAADATDLYAFVSPDAPDTVTL